MIKLIGIFLLLGSTALTKAPAVAAQPSLFEFNSSFWINLHHYLHALARVPGALMEELPATASAAERERWNTAVASYRERFGKRSLLFDEELVDAKARLAMAGDADSLAAAKLPDAHRDILESAAPIYRRYWWKTHDAANRRFIDALRPLLARHGASVAKRLAGTFGATWPASPIRVDLVHDAGPPGNAYTISEPTTITVAATDPRHQGNASLEALFHEASHRWDATLMQEVDAAAARLGVRSPRNLWHGLLFYNAGSIVSDALRAAGVADYRMYMESEQMFDRAYRGMRPAITTHWPAFLAGNLTRQQAIERIVRDVTK
jgi:hypothetical protein